MIACEKCGAKYPTERLFCGKCKNRLGIRCSICGFINLLDDRFCGICLTELRAETEIPVEQKLQTPVISGSPLYEEIQMGAQEDAAFADNDDEKLDQERIDSLFQSDKES